MFKKLLITTTLILLSLSSIAQVVEEITVTSARKAQSLQDVAISVQTLSGEEIADNHLISSSDLAELMPGYAFSNAIGNGVATKVRGLFIQAIGAASTDGAAFNLNGHNVAGSNFTESGFLDLERLEILEGPQGTLYGRNTTTGLINVISARPGSGGYLTYSRGEEGYSNLRFAQDISVSSDVGARVALQKFDKNPTVNNLGTGGEIDSRDSGSIRLSLDWSISDTQQLNTNFSRYVINDSRLNIHTQNCSRDRFHGCSPYETNALQHLNNAANTEGTISNTYDGLTLIDTSTDYFSSPLASNAANVVSKDYDIQRQLTQNIYQLEHVWDITDDIVISSKVTNYERTYLHMDDSDHVKADTPLLSALGTPFSVPTMEFVCLGTLQVNSLMQSTECSEVFEDQEQYEVNVVSDFDGPHNFTAGLYSFESDFENAYTINTTSYMIATDFELHPFSDTIFNGQLDTYGGSTFYTQLATNIALYKSALGSAVIADGGNLSGANTRAVGSAIVNNLQGGGAAALACPAAACVKSMPIEAGGLITDQRTGRTDQAFYGEYYYDINEDYKLTLGGRYMENSTTVQTLSGLSDNTGYVATASALECLTPAYEACYAKIAEVERVKDSASTFKTSLQRFYDQGMAYVSYTEGYRPGSVNSDGTPYAQEDTTSIEIGTRNTLMDGRLQLNATAFLQETENAHYSVIRGSAAIVEEGLDVEHMGLSLAATYYLTESTVLNLNVLATDSELSGGSSIDPLNPTQATSHTYYTSAQFDALLTSTVGAATADLFTSCDTSCSTSAFAMDNKGNFLTNAQGGVTVLTQLGSTSTAVPVSGNKVPFTADLDYNLSVTQFMATPFGLGSASLTYSHKGEFEGDIYNNGRFRVPESDYLDLNLTLQPNGSDWYFSLWAKNLEDKRNVTSLQRAGVLTGGVQNVTFSEGTRAGIDFGIDF